ncbi:MAG: hypothetical protein KTR14_01435 [Vampirovibrio sp.]|nr:hypothetical protein [Vampirovibrio sp.]
MGIKFYCNSRLRFELNWNDIPVDGSFFGAVSKAGMARVVKVVFVSREGPLTLLKLSLRVGKLGEHYFMKKLMKRNKGQGVVEYGGALVIAAVIVAAVIALVQGEDGALATMFDTVLNNIETYFTGAIPE